ncbi:hypothetical protein B0H14DRAFT_2651532 [Mycena olivaceomarginata]|nr:hypothetical protein B0H14DRAFT_2651532 [Mycena olivaceomarginata]
MITYPDTGTHRWSLARVDVSFDWTRMPSGNDIALHLLLVDPPHRTFAKVGAAVYHGGHDIIVARTSRCARALPSVPFPTAALIPSLSGAAHRRTVLPQARACRSVFPSGFSPSFARTPRPSPPSCSAPLHPAYRPSPHSPPPRSARSRWSSSTLSSLHSTHGRARAPKTFSFGHYLPRERPTTKPKPKSSVARPAPRLMGSVTVLPPPPQRLRVPDYAESSRPSSGVGVGWVVLRCCNRAEFRVVNNRRDERQSFAEWKPVGGRHKTQTGYRPDRNDWEGSDPSVYGDSRFLATNEPALFEYFGASPSHPNLHVTIRASRASLFIIIRIPCKRVNPSCTRPFSKHAERLYGRDATDHRPVADGNGSEP